MAESSFALLPVRLFTGWVFLGASLAKLTHGWVGHPRVAEPVQAWLDGHHTYAFFEPVLRQVVLPWATFWSSVLAIGEVCIAAGLLAGLLTRAAAFAGLLLTLSILLGRGDGFDANATAPFVVMCAALLLSHSGRTLGLDAALAHRLPRWLT